MSAGVTIVDYGSGNLLSVARALEHCGANVRLSGDPAEIERADRLLVPGVGAFAEGMHGLEQQQLVEPIKAFARAGRPLLGICLGMQMLASRSLEFGETEGLRLIEGDVVAIPNVTVDGARLKTPHIGWASLHPGPQSSWGNTVMRSLSIGASAYLVHSFHMKPADSRDILALATYGGHEITAAIQRENIIGCQFHPEKSGENGLKLLGHFLEL
ncbi:imidazole glycerol phosphate synthase subunit HisH [Pelomonas sp. P7]|uniref:Imidazole glycerol phosphate synthase subunit HisH n=1 Tax=Pelomonas caseinilytica TaxID=2906763 RepID=A0ABS8XB55_9BURK|nr:imidazole glycerol phosphate synthase subunit HisH [Pelomonas sp. P7]MCE4538172.1 imidazole glycerol phosphate synthase subunit HisH [Pelomonas sp. P7]